MLRAQVAPRQASSAGRRRESQPAAAPGTLLLSDAARTTATYR